MANYALLWIALFLLILLVVARPKKQEAFCGTTGVTYSDIKRIPDTTYLNKEPPFYDLNAVRTPVCAYRNYTYPPPMDYSPLEDCLEGDFAKRYMYWYTNPMLSAAETSYIV